jgi:hypothetical protein
MLILKLVILNINFTHIGFRCMRFVSMDMVIEQIRLILNRAAIHKQVEAMESDSMPVNFVRIEVIQTSHIMVLQNQMKHQSFFR